MISGDSNVQAGGEPLLLVGKSCPENQELWSLLSLLIYSGTVKGDQRERGGGVKGKGDQIHGDGR